MMHNKNETWSSVNDKKMHLQLTIKDVMEDSMRRQETSSTSSSSRRSKDKRRSSALRQQTKTRLSDNMMMGLMGDMSSSMSTSFGGRGQRRRDNSASDLESIGEVNMDNSSSDEDDLQRPSPTNIQPINTMDDTTERRNMRRQNHRRLREQQQQDQLFGTGGMDSSNSSSAPSMRQVSSMMAAAALANKNMESCDTLPSLRKIRSGTGLGVLLGRKAPKEDFSKDADMKNQNWTPQKAKTTPPRSKSSKMAELLALQSSLGSSELRPLSSLIRSSGSGGEKMKGKSLLGNTTNVLASAAEGTGKLMRRTTSATGSAMLLVGNTTMSATKSAANWSAEAPLKVAGGTGKLMRRTTSATGSAMLLVGNTTMSAAKTTANWSADAVNPKKMMRRTSSATVALASRSKSIGSDLFEMQKTLAKGPSKMLRRASVEEPEKDPLFVEMATWNPMDPEDRAKYDDNAVKKLLRRNPEAARAKYEHKVGGRGNLTISRYPLATLVALGASVETLRVAIRAHPMALRPSKDFRSTPLHTACTTNTPLEVVKYLHEKYPDAIKETTTYVFLPLHNACQTGIPEPCSFEMIKFLVEAYPEGLMTINKLGDTPLRTARRNKHMPPEVLLYLEEETDRVFNQEENEELRESVIQRQSWGSSHNSSSLKTDAAAAMKSLSGSVCTEATESLSCEFSENSAHTQYSNTECSQHTPLPPLFETGFGESCSDFDCSFAVDN